MRDYPALYRKLERTLSRIEESEDVARTLETILEHIVVTYRDDLGFSSGRLYRLEDEGYRLAKVVGNGSHRTGFVLPVDYAPVARVRALGYVMMQLGDPGIRSDIEAALGVDHFAAICFGPAKEYIIALTLEGAFEPDEVLYSLNAVRHVCDLKLRHRRIERVMMEAREIQESLLRPPPDFAGYEIGVKSRPADEVGGDLYVFVPVNESILGVGIADVAGHGLAAALQARDVAIGLMMGIGENLKMVATIERLNQVIHETSLASKFVTMLYCEVERNGNLIYVNAGHLPQIVLPSGRDELVLLRKGGMVLGPSPRARYQRGFYELGHGDLVLLYTDGITEAESPAGEAYGLDRLAATLRRLRDGSAQRIVDGILADADAFRGEGRQIDDQTLLVMRRL